MTLRRRLEDARLPVWLLGKSLTGWLRLCLATTDWRVEGREALTADLSRGPVLYLLWHSRSLLGPAHWPSGAAPLTSLHAGSPIGRAGGVVQASFGLDAVQMTGRRDGQSANRLILSAARAGQSIGMVGDGPWGPARQLNDAALSWATRLRRPVWAYAFSTTRQRRANSWDRQLVPLPFGQGAVVFRRLDLGAASGEAARAALAAHLDGAAEAADRMVGLPPGP